jgi:hypothetical protein
VVFVVKHQNNMKIAPNQPTLNFSINKRLFSFWFFNNE